MKRAEHYVKLRASRPDAGDGEPVAITLDELAEILDCTKQNVRLVLRQLVAAAWIRWEAGRGRGNYSALTFLRSVEQVVYELALERIAQGDLAGAFAQMHVLRPSLKARFMEQLSTQFGLQQEQTEAEARDLLRDFVLAPFRMLDPAKLYLAREFNMVTQIFAGLVKRNATTLAIEPHIAHHWEVDAAGRVWTFYLRKGVLFHHGRELTAADVEYTLRRLLDPAIESPFRWAVEDVVEMRVLQKTVVQLTLREPNYLFLHLLAAPPFSIVPLEADSTLAATFSRLPVGSGPFRVVRNDGQQCVLEAHAAYFQGRPFLDRVEYWVVPPEQLASGEWSQMAIRVGESLAGNPEDWQEQKLSKRFVQYLTFNLNKQGPQQDARFRRAFAMAFNRAGLIATLGGIRTERTDGFLSVREPERLYNPEWAKQWLAEIGYRGESLQLFTFQREENRHDAWWIQAQCQEVGIPVEVTFCGVSEMQQRYQEADLILKAEMIDEHVEFSYCKAILSANNVIYNCLSPAQRQMIQQELSAVMREPDAGVRLKQLQAIEQRLKGDVMLLFLYHEQYVVTYRPYIQGVVPFSTGVIDLKNVWFKR